MTYMCLSAELNRGVANSPSYLWCHHSPTRGDPIVELMVVTVTTNLTSEGKEEDNNDNCPKKFEKNPRNMLYGSDKCAYLCFRRSKDVDPIGQLRVLYGDNSQPDEGFTRLGTPVYSGTTDSPDISSIYLSYATVSKGNNDVYVSVSVLVSVMVICMRLCMCLYSFCTFFHQKSLTCNS